MTQVTGDHENTKSNQGDWTATKGSSNLRDSICMRMCPGDLHGLCRPHGLRLSWNTLIFLLPEMGAGPWWTQILVTRKPGSHVEGKGCDVLQDLKDKTSETSNDFCSNA